MKVSSLQPWSPSGLRPMQGFLVKIIFRYGYCHKPDIGKPPPPFLLSSAALEWWLMLISTERTPIRYDMVHVLLTIRVTIVVIRTHSSCSKTCLTKHDKERTHS